MKSLLVCAALLLVLAGCGSSEEVAPAPPTLAARALPELESRARTLDADALAVDALEPGALKRLLEEAGFESGREREFSGKTRTFDRVLARALRFEDAEGAEAYVGWLRSHRNDILGRAAPAKVVPPGESGVAFTLVPCGTCKKELPTFVAGWRRGDVVLWLLAAGPGANAQTFGDLTHELDAVVG